MTRIGTRLFGLVLAGALAALLPARAADESTALGSGPAYDALGKVPSMHEGRVKPLDTVAREEVKQVYSRETIKLRNLDREIDRCARSGAGLEANKQREARDVGPRRRVSRLDDQP